MEKHNMTTPIPSSPIPQPTPKIGTRYVAVDDQAASTCPDMYCTTNAHKDMKDLENVVGVHIYPLLDPSDAAELERLRKVEDEAAQAFIDDTNLGTRAELGAAFFAWTKARAARIAFEAKIGGGV